MKETKKRKKINKSETSGIIIVTDMASTIQKNRKRISEDFIKNLLGVKLGDIR